MTSRTPDLSAADLVVLSMLAEQAMHGYELWAELTRRQVWKWAAISRPQVYYSLKKLQERRYIRPVGDSDPALGPERIILQPTAAGRRMLSDSLARADWATQRPPPPFLTWMALSWLARPGVFKRQLTKRRAFLARELAREEETLAAVRREVGHEFHEAVWMIKLMIQQIRGELRWLHRVESESARRAKAKHT